MKKKVSIIFFPTLELFFIHLYQSLLDHEAVKIQELSLQYAKFQCLLVERTDGMNIYALPGGEH